MGLVRASVALLPDAGRAYRTAQRLVYHSSDHLDPHRQEEALTTVDPPRAVGCQAAAGHHAMHVRMVQQALAQGVKHRHEADTGAEVTPVLGNFVQGPGSWNSSPDLGLPNALCDCSVTAV